MADGPRILELRSGRGEPSTISLKQGSVLDPTSVGTGGMWRIDGPGVLDVHGYIYFDGKALYVQSADDKSPVTVNKHRVATAWTEVRAPSSITLGEAEIVYRDEAPAVYDDADETVASPMAPAKPKAKPEFVPGGGAFVNRADDESTRFAPIEGIPGASGPMMDPLRPAAGTPAAPFPPQPMPSPMELPPGMMGMQGMQPGMGMHPGMMQPGMPMQPGMGMQGVPPGMQPMQPGMMPGMPMQPGMMPGMPMQPGMVPTTSPGGTDPGPGKMGWTRFKAEWEALPPIRRALYIMAPFTFAAACFILFDDPPPPQPVKTTPSASVAPSASVPTPVPSGAQVMVGPEAGVEPTSALDASVEPATTTTTAETNPATKPNDKGEKDAGNSGTPPSTPGKRTTERMAADAWAEGNFPKAAQLYDELATENPQNPAYREAARILREKIDAGAR